MGAGALGGGEVVPSGVDLVPGGIAAGVGDADVPAVGVEGDAGAEFAPGIPIAGERVLDFLPCGFGFEGDHACSFGSPSFSFGSVAARASSTVSIACSINPTF